MKIRSRRRIALKAGLVMIAAVLGVAGLLDLSPEKLSAIASASGPSPSFTGAPLESNCTACHVGSPANSGTGNISVAGVPANYLPGQAIPVTVTVSQADAVIYGFQMTALDQQGRMAGTFTVKPQSPRQQQIVTGFVNGNERRYIEHTSDGVVPSQFGSKSWTFTWTAPPQRIGRIGFYAAGNAANSDATSSNDQIYTAARASLSGTAISNFDADTNSDIAVFRPSTGVWFWLNSTDGSFRADQFGQAGDVVTAGDYDGDGKTDQSIWRPSNGLWAVQKSAGGFIFVQWGLSTDIPVVGDYDGDLKSDVAVWRPSNGIWYIWRSSDSHVDARQWGQAGDKTVQGDYDADGKTDIAVWRPSNGIWYVWRSSDNGFFGSQFGQDGDLPVPADYDGEGRTNVAVFRTSNGIWFVQNADDGQFTGTQFGFGTDLPTPADYDGDGKTDISVFRDGLWFYLRSSDGAFRAEPFGLGSDVPIPRGYITQ